MKIKNENNKKVFTKNINGGLNIFNQNLGRDE